VKINLPLFSPRTGQKNSLAHCLRAKRKSGAARVGVKEEARHAIEVKL
jgi:hypothetical protein